MSNAAASVNAEPTHQNRCMPAAFPGVALFVVLSLRVAQPTQLLLVSLGELVAEQIAEAGVCVPDPITKLVAVEVPIFASGSTQKHPFLALPVEFRLQAFRGKMRKHGLVRQAH